MPSTRQKKTIFMALSTLVISSALVGCGGGSSSSTNIPQDNPTINSQAGTVKLSYSIPTACVSQCGVLTGYVTLLNYVDSSGKQQISEYDSTISLNNFNCKDISLIQLNQIALKQHEEITKITASPLTCEDSQGATHVFHANYNQSFPYLITDPKADNTIQVTYTENPTVAAKFDQSSFGAPSEHFA